MIVYMIFHLTPRPGMVSLVVSEAGACFKMHLFEERSQVLHGLALICIISCLERSLELSPGSCIKYSEIILKTWLKLLSLKASRGNQSRNWETS